MTIISAPARGPVRISAALVATVVFLTAIAPLATDMYVPAFPDVSRDLHATATQVQLTLTTFFAGMAAGQLLGGPVSDQLGRRRPLLAATVLMLAASAACALVSASVMVALFAYVATSAFILQSMNGLSPLAYSVAFAANAGGMTVAALLAARLAGRVATRRVILTGQVLALAAGVAMLAGALWLGTPLVLALACFFALMAAVGLIWGNAGALAAEAVPSHPGTGSAVLGMLQWGTAGVAAPLAGLGGTGTAVPMAVLMTAGAAVSVLGSRLSRPRAATAPAAVPVAAR